MNVDVGIVLTKAPPRVLVADEDIAKKYLP
jgi:hypothetical protein